MLQVNMFPTKNAQVKTAQVKVAHVKTAQVNSAQVKNAQIKNAQVKSAQLPRYLKISIQLISWLYSIHVTVLL